MRVRIDLDGAPRGKGRGRAVATPKGTRVYTDNKTRTYESQLRFAGMQAMSGRAPTAFPVRLTMSIFFAIPPSWSRRKRDQALAGTRWPTMPPDADNFLKCCDALNGVVWNDDSQVVIATVFKAYSERPGLSIEVDTIEPAVFVGPSELDNISVLQSRLDQCEISA